MKARQAALERAGAGLSFFVRSGYVDTGNGRLTVAGGNSYAWSCVAAAYTNGTTASAYYLYFDTGVYPSNNYVRSLGFPLRCLAD